jgi:hypothetical protein
MDKILIKISRLWNGKESLSVAFWGLYAPLFFCSQGLKLLVSNGYVNSDGILFMVSMIFLVGFKVFSLICLWRCSSNTKEQNSPFTWLAKGIVIFGIVTLLPIVLLPLEMLL